MSPPTTVALCVTCLGDQIMPEVGVATVRLLRRAGFDVVFPTAQTCCGQPFFNSGFQKEAGRLARRLIEIFEPYEAVVLPSGSCTTMIRREYAHLLDGDGDWPGRAEALARKTYELTEFLARFHPNFAPTNTPSPPTKPVTYHDSCHMCRQLGLGAEARHLLSTAGCNVREMAEPDRCCGFGGLFSMRMPEVANAMTTEKLNQAAATGADTLVTADPGCLMQMRGMADAATPDLQHIAVVLEEITRPAQKEEE